MKLQLLPSYATLEVATISQVDYRSMTVSQLRTEAKLRGIEGYSTMLKHELIELLEG